MPRPFRAVTLSRASTLDLAPGPVHVPPSVSLCGSCGLFLLTGVGVVFKEAVGKSAHRAAAILNQRAGRPFGASEVWLRRAAQARRIARMLSVADAAILDAYAIECEAEARIAEQKLLIAA